MLPKDLSKLTVVQLKEGLKSRNQSVTGKKAELIARLQGCIEAALQEGQEEKKESDAAAETSAGAVEAAPVAEPAADAPPQDKMGSAEAKPDEERAASAAEPAAESAPNVPKPVAETGSAEVAPDAAAATEQPVEPAEPETAMAPPQPAAPAGADDEEEEIDYGGSEPEDAPAAEQAQDAAEPVPQQEQPTDEGPRAVPASVKSQSKMFGAAMGALAQGAPAPGDGRKRGAEDGAAHDERPGKVQRHVSGAAAAGAGGGGAPPAQGPITRALHIDGFVRPFTLNQARDLLGRWGTVLSMWFPNIKNYCYAVYETRAQAEAARAALWQLQWPSGTTRSLQPRFVSLAEAEGAIGKGAGNPDFRVQRTSEDGPDVEEVLEPGAEAGAAAAPAETAASLVNQGRGVNGTAAAAEGVADLRELLSRRRHSSDQQQEQPRGGRQAALPPPAHGADAALSLDDLFRKTVAKPHLYWLPLTDEQVAEKKRAAAAAEPAQG